MPEITISARVAQRIRSAATRPFQSNSRILPDGTHVIRIGQEVYDRLDDRRMAGESFSDTIERMFAGKPN